MYLKIHSHPLAPNPLTYIQHKHRHQDYQIAVGQAVEHRYAGLSYNISLHLRVHEGLQLNSEAYYNAKRSGIKITPDERINGMLKELTTAGFHTRSRWIDKVNTDGNIFAKQLEQIFFINGDQIRLGRRFVSDFVMECDATFSNNLLRMPLANIVGITNTGRTFSLAFSFIRSESSENFNFIFQSLDELVFYDIPRPKVVLSDQAKGFIKSLADQWSTMTFHQLCEWHMVQNIKKRLVDGTYNKEQQDRIQHLVWKYIHSLTPEKASAARHDLYYELHADERTYMEEQWRMKEVQVLRCHTQYYANLGAYSTQRNEGHHVAVKQFLNPQITLEQATSRLVEHLHHAILCLDNEEAESRTKVPRFLNKLAFKHLIGQVSLLAINHMKVEWEEAKKISDMDLENCLCTIIGQFGLPCRHRLASLCEPSSSDPIPIPINLLHPRWRIDEPNGIPFSGQWVMPLTLHINQELPNLYPVQHDRYKSNGQELLLRSLHDLEMLQSELADDNAEAAEVIAQRVQIFAKALREEFGSLDETLPPVWEYATAGAGSSLPQRKTKGKAKARTLTSTEFAERRNKRSRQLPPSAHPPPHDSQASELLGQPTTGTETTLSLENETQDCIHVFRSTAPV